jgi:hypothetical protein
MPSIFKTKNQKASKPSLLIHSTSGTSISYGVDVLRGRARKLQKTSRELATGQFDSTIMSVSSTGAGSNSFASNPPLSHHWHPSIGDADLVLQPNHFTAFVSQTSNERSPFPTSTVTEERHSKEIPSHAPSTLSQDSIPAVFVSQVQTDCEASTYDAILVSTLQKTLGMKYLDIPATKTPPNSPAAIQEGGFGSLMGVSMAIMHGTT